MHRCFVLLVACAAPTDRDAAPPVWTYSPGTLAWPLGAQTGTIGRSQPPQYVLRQGVVGKVTAPLRLPTVWAVPGDGPPRAIVYGLAGDAPAVELIDIDAGKIAWRDSIACAAPVVGVTDNAVVCADAKGTRAIGLDGKKRWANEETFIAMTDDRVVIAGAGESVILDAATGHEVARVRLPAPPPAPVVRGRPSPLPVTSDSIIASCGDAGRELFAYGQDGRLVRIIEGPGGPRSAWATPLATIASIDACDGPSVIVATTGETGPEGDRSTRVRSASEPWPEGPPLGGTTLVALARETGKPLGLIANVRGYWPARDGSPRLEVSTAAGVTVWGRDLVGPPAPTPLPVLGELLAKRGPRRLVRATPLTAVLIDASGVHAFMPLAQLGAALGDHAVLAASWLGSPGETVHRIAIPHRYNRALRLPARPNAVGVAAELRDLPQLAVIDAAGAIAKPDTGKHAVTALALDVVDPHVGYATALEQPEDDKTGAGVARFDLAARAWSWYRSDGCGPGTPVALAASRTLVACAARSSKGASVHATSRGGIPLWRWRGTNVDAIAAARDVVLVFDGDRLYVLDGRDGRDLATYASDDGAAVRAIVLDVDGMELVVMYQRGRVIARLPRAAMVPAWTIAIAGVVRALAPAGDGVLVELEDGDAYRIAARTGAAVALPGLDLTWAASGDVITGQAVGGPIPQPRVATPVPPRPLGPPPRRPLAPPPPRDPDGPPVLAKAWPAPPPMPTSWQYTLYELAGGLRARNDYALAPPITPATRRGPGESPLVVQSGPELREVLVLDPRTGDPLRRVQLPEDAVHGLAFSTIVDGKPVVGTLLAKPLRIVVF